MSSVLRSGVPEELQRATRWREDGGTLAAFGGGAPPGELGNNAGLQLGGGARLKHRGQILAAPAHSPSPPCFSNK
eukprot:scaffold679_cov374-Prasinococcus_capsulatus_cf.AAC.5